MQTIALHTRLDHPDLRSFWELEEVSVPILRNPEHERALTLYHAQTARDTVGRYTVPLIFDQHPPLLGDSYSTALKVYRSLRIRLLNNDELRTLYVNFMADYLNEHHMSLECRNAALSDTVLNPGYFLPHHAVLKTAPNATRVRVVFNGSKITTNGRSLNDNMLSGPPLQRDIFDILLTFRTHLVTVTCDIRHMFRQILVIPEHRIYQRILWSPELSHNPDVYSLHTVTYGTKCAPFLAIQTLLRLADDEGHQFPRAAFAIRNHTYVDDIITGASSVEEAITLQEQLQNLLATAGLQLRKWTSNRQDVLSRLPAEHLETSLSFQSTQSLKILGLQWTASCDHFSFKIELNNNATTKREMLSQIASIYDPLGIISPVTFRFKRYMQHLWTLGYGWDERLSSAELEKWNELKSSLTCLQHFTIPRYIQSVNPKSFLVGFADASEAGYAAVIFLCQPTHSSHNSSSIFLLASKTKVAPLKLVSIPRLELCAALLLSQLLVRVAEQLDVDLGRSFAFSDSMVALSWITSPPHKWTTFVANRTAQIQELTAPVSWKYVPSAENPADRGSRGLDAASLITDSLWWTGPSWLKDDPSTWPTHEIPRRTEEARRAKVIRSLLVVSSNYIFAKYSSLTRLIRITAWMLRFIRRCSRIPSCRQTYLTSDELETARLTWILLTQQEIYSSERQRIRDGKPCTYHLQKLNPFLDNLDILRVGGRLQYSALPFQTIHPILLPANHVFTVMLINHFHITYLHPSPRTLQALIQRQYWIPQLRNMVRQCSYKCITCFKSRPTAIQPIMAPLPSHRVRNAKPFSSVGIDYGGPFLLTPWKLRGIRRVKSYLCLFICTVTKAVHLELAVDLSTDSFLRAFKRFISRRGRVTEIYSDSGTNFVGASRYLSDLQLFLRSDKFKRAVTSENLFMEMQWNFIPPSAPHFGGLWESGIKSAKYHISRAIGNQVLTYEEFSTVLANIESILNSRPLCVDAHDPNDPSILTPAHFLLQEPIYYIPDADKPDPGTNPVTRRQLIGHVTSTFWKRWHAEYLNTLQQRMKWHINSPNLTKDTIVVVRGHASEPNTWKLGRVTKVYAGDDGITRVARVAIPYEHTTKPGCTELTRPVNKLCPLPVYN